MDKLVTYLTGEALITFKRGELALVHKDINVSNLTVLDIRVERYSISEEPLLLERYRIGKYIDGRYRLFFPEESNDAELVYADAERVVFYDLQVMVQPEDTSPFGVLRGRFVAQIAPQPEEKVPNGVETDDPQYAQTQNEESTGANASNSESTITATGSESKKQGGCFGQKGGESSSSNSTGCFSANAGGCFGTSSGGCFSKLGLLFSWIGRLLMVWLLVSIFLGFIGMLKIWDKGRGDGDGRVPEQREAENKVETREELVRDTLNIDDTDHVLDRQLITHQLSWLNYQDENLDTEYKIYRDEANDSKGFRNRISVVANQYSIWASIYEKLAQQDEKAILKTVDEYREMQEKYGLSDAALAEAVVSSVQEIPYVLVHQGSCAQADQQGGFVRDYHRSGRPCLAQTHLGIQAPAEFVEDLRGDCDTRSLFLYLVLKKLGYRPAIMVSMQYGHAILGLNAKGSGKFKTYQGLRYYTWETTAPDFQLGQMHPDCNNMNYWEIVLN